MSLPVEKVAPTAVVVAVVAWCCWPYLTEQASGLAADKGAALPSIAETLLRPSIKPPCTRDPFQASDDTPSPADYGQAPTATLGEHSDDSASNEAGLVLAAPREGDDTARPPLEGSPEPASTADADPLINGLVLDATYLRGNRQVAIIGGHIYRQGQQLQIPGAPRDVYVVRQILPGKVLLQGRGRTLEIVYRSLLEEGTPTARKEVPDDE